MTECKELRTEREDLMTECKVRMTKCEGLMTECKGLMTSRGTAFPGPERGFLRRAGVFRGSAGVLPMGPCMIADQTLSDRRCDPVWSETRQIFRMTCGRKSGKVAPIRTSTLLFT